MANAPDKEQIYLDYKDKITRFVGSKVGDYSQVEDIVSNIFVKVYSHLDSFDPEKASISTWIYTIANNTVLDYYRGRRVFEEVPEELSDDTEVDAELLQEESLRMLADALERLSERERDLIVLHYYKGMLLKDVAAKMGMSYANAKIIHKKALTSLRGLLED